MALIGTAFAETANVTIDNVNNNGTITAENRDNNTNGGATGYHIAGIAGFTTNDGASQQKVIISDCINYGDITSATGRTAGHRRSGQPLYPTGQLRKSRQAAEHLSEKRCGTFG